MKYTKSLLPLLFAATCGTMALFSACHDHGSSSEGGVNFDATFRATYNGNRFVKYFPYNYNGYPLKLSRFTLFLSDITLLNGSESVEISDVEYLDFTPDNASNDTSVLLKVTFKNVPEGEYTGIRMGYGVAANNNSKNPADFPTTSPLYNDNEYWLGWKSYIFAKIEGTGDANNDNQDDHFLIYHCGGDGVYKTFTFNEPIHVHAGEAGIKIDLDLLKLFIMDDGRYYNLVTNSATSNKKDSLRIANDIMSKFDKATSITQ
jgi:hypothetical protein